MMLDMQIATDRHNAYLARVERRKREEARGRVRSGLSRRGLLGSIGACVGLAMAMAPTVSKAAFDTEIIDIKRLGATGDGVTDDTAAIQRALNLKAHCYAPPGTYLVTSPLSFAVAGQRLFGAGSGVTIFTASSSFSGSSYPQGNSLFYFGQFQPGPQIADLKLTCQTPGSVSQGINAVNSPRFKIRDCRISMFVTCLNMTGNSGGADIDGLEIWAGANSAHSGLAISIDGSVDTVNFDRLRVWPFEDPAGGTFTASITSNVLTVTVATGNFLAVGQTITGSGVSATITSFGTGTGGTGTYNITANSNVTSRSMTASGISFVSQTGIISGRVDGLFITNSMFICLNQLNLANGVGPVASFAGTTNGTTSLVVTGITSGSVQVGSTLFIAGVSQGVTIVSGAGGGNGTYVLSGTVGAAGPTAMQVGNAGPTFGMVSNTDFDSLNGVIISAGYLGLSNCILTNGGGALFGSTATNLVTVTGGRVQINGCTLFSTGTISCVAMNAGDVTVANCNFQLDGNATSPAVSCGGGILSCSNNIFTRNSALGGAYIIDVTAGRATIVGNRSPVDGSGNFIHVATDDWHRVVYNATGGWTNSFPTPSVGVYSPN